MSHSWTTDDACPDVDTAPQAPEPEPIRRGLSHAQTAHRRGNLTGMRRTHTIATLASLAALTLTACGGSSDTADDKPKPPPYEIVEQDDSGNSRTVTVEVDTAKNLKAVFDDLASTLTDEAGYHVSINCSTGGTDTFDNRLANGRVAVGNMGAAATGLEAGATSFEALKGRTCPTK